MKTNNLETVFLENYDAIKLQLENKFNLLMDEAGDKDYVRGQYYLNLSNEFSIKEKEFSPINLVYYDKAENYLKQNKNNTVEAAFAMVFDGAKLSQQKEGVIKLSTLKAYQDYLFFLNNENFKALAKETPQVESNSNPNFTTRRQVLSIYFLLSEMKVYGSTDKTTIANFIQFLTGKEANATEIKNTNIYKFIREPFKTNDNNLKSDLEFIKEYYVKLGMNSIVDSIEKEINKIK
jgi:hypothetical protein